MTLKSQIDLGITTKGHKEVQQLAKDFTAMKNAAKGLRKTKLSKAQIAEAQALKKQVKLEKIKAIQAEAYLAITRIQLLLEKKKEKRAAKLYKWLKLQKAIGKETHSQEEKQHRAKLRAINAEIAAKKKLDRVVKRYHQFVAREQQKEARRIAKLARDKAAKAKQTARIQIAEERKVAKVRAAEHRKELNRIKQRQRTIRDGLFRLRHVALDFGQAAQRAFFMGTMALGTLGYAIKQVTENVVEGMAQWELYGRQIDVLMGSAAKGATAMSELIDFALTSPLNLDETIKATVRLLNYGHQYVDILRDGRGILETYTKAATFTDKPLDQVVEAVEKLRSGMFLRRSLSPIGLTPTFFEKAGFELEKGRPMMLDVNPLEVYRIAIEELEKKYKDFKFADLTQVKLRNVKDHWDVFWKEVGFANKQGIDDLLDIYLGMLGRLIDFTKTPAFTKFSEAIQDIILGPLGEAVSKAFDNLIDYLEANPDALAKAVNTATEALKSFLAFVGGAGITAVLAQFIQLIASLALALTSGGKLAGIGIAVGVAGAVAAFVGLKKAIDNLIPRTDKLKEKQTALGDELEDGSRIVKREVLTSFESWWKATIGQTEATDQLKNMLFRLKEKVLPSLIRSFENLVDIFVDVNGDLTEFGEFTFNQLAKSLNNIVIILEAMASLVEFITRGMRNISDGNIYGARYSPEEMSGIKAQVRKSKADALGLPVLGGIWDVKMPPNKVGVQSGLGALRMIEAGLDPNKRFVVDDLDDVGAGKAAKDVIGDVITKYLESYAKLMNKQRVFREAGTFSLERQKEISESASKLLIGIFEALTPEQFSKLMDVDPVLGGRVLSEFTKTDRDPWREAEAQAKKDKEKELELDRANITAVQEYTKTLETSRATFEKLVDVLDDIYQNLRDVGAGLGVGLQAMLGFEKSADMQAGVYLLKRLREAWSAANEPGISAEERGKRLLLAGELGGEALSFGGSLIGKRGAEEMLKAWISDVQPIIESIQQAISEHEGVLKDAITIAGESMDAAAIELETVGIQLQAMIVKLDQLLGKTIPDWKPGGVEPRGKPTIVQPSGSRVVTTDLGGGVSVDCVEDAQGGST